MRHIGGGHQSNYYENLVELCYVHHMNNPVTSFGIEPPAVAAIIIVCIVAGIIYATISAFLKANSDDKNSH